jgi:hypothetical protein
VSASISACRVGALATNKRHVLVIAHELDNIKVLCNTAAGALLGLLLGIMAGVLEHDVGVGVSVGSSIVGVIGLLQTAAAFKYR